MSYLLSVTYSDMLWVCHGNFLSFGDRAGIPLPLTSPLSSIGDSRLRRLSEVEFPLVTSPEAHSKCSTTWCTYCKFRARRSVLALTWHSQGYQGALTPPTAQSPVSRLSGHDLVAISMGMGGWVFKNNSTSVKHECLSQNGVIVRARNFTCTNVCVCNMRIQPENVNISQANDLFTPQPAKHDKHIH
jgi:hypothetical protein